MEGEMDEGRVGEEERGRVTDRHIHWHILKQTDRELNHRNVIHVQTHPLRAIDDKL